MLQASRSISWSAEWSVSRCSTPTRSSMSTRRVESSVVTRTRGMVFSPFGVALVIAGPVSAAKRLRTRPAPPFRRGERGAPGSRTADCTTPIPPEMALRRRCAGPLRLCHRSSFSTPRARKQMPLCGRGITNAYDVLSGVCRALCANPESTPGHAPSLRTRPRRAKKGRPERTQDGPEAAMFYWNVAD